MWKFIKSLFDKREKKMSIEFTQTDSDMLNGNPKFKKYVKEMQEDNDHFLLYGYWPPHKHSNTLPELPNNSNHYPPKRSTAVLTLLGRRSRKL